MILPLVSIIIPCFNGSAFVAEAIRSALDQTYPNKEVIVIDDGSTDNSLDIIKGFGDQIRWESPVRQGGAAARNLGLKQARGTLIQFLDADDLLAPEKLALQVPALLRSEADFVYSDWLEFSAEDPARIWTRSPYGGSADAVVLALHRQNIQTSSPLHRVQTLRGIGGFREELPCCQERDLHLRLACHGARFHYLPYVLHTVRRFPGSVSQDLVKVFGWLRVVVQDAYADLNRREQLTEERRMALASFLAWQGRILLRCGKYDSAAQNFAEALKIHSAGPRQAYTWVGYALVRLTDPVRAESILQKLKRIEIFALDPVKRRIMALRRCIQQRSIHLW